MTRQASRRQSTSLTSSWKIAPSFSGEIAPTSLAASNPLRANATPVRFLRPEEAAHELLKLPCTDLPTTAMKSSLTKEELDEVVDEEIFLDQSEAAQRDQASFEKAIDQLDQFMEDRALLLRRNRTDLAGRIESAEGKRDAALGADARQNAEAKLRKLELEAEELDSSLSRLATRQDDDYEKWKKHAHSRRYRSPKAERLFNVEFELA